MLVEVADSDITWLEPRDITFDQAVLGVNVDKRHGISSNHGGGVHVVFADGHSYYLYDDVSPTALKALFTIAGGEIVDDDLNVGFKVSQPK